MEAGLAHPGDRNNLLKYKKCRSEGDVIGCLSTPLLIASALLVLQEIVSVSRMSHVHPGLMDDGIDAVIVAGPVFVKCVPRALVDRRGDLWP